MGSFPEPVTYKPATYVRRWTSAELARTKLPLSAGRNFVYGGRRQREREKRRRKNEREKGRIALASVEARLENHVRTYEKLRLSEGNNSTKLTCLASLSFSLSLSLSVFLSLCTVSRNDALRTVYFTIQRKAGPPWNSHAYRHRRKISHELN